MVCLRYPISLAKFRWFFSIAATLEGLHLERTIISRADFLEVLLPAAAFMAPQLRQLICDYEFEPDVVYSLASFVHINQLSLENWRFMESPIAEILGLSALRSLEVRISTIRSEICICRP
jgi:hypothetical protein